MSYDGNPLACFHALSMAIDQVKVHDIAVSTFDAYLGTMSSCSLSMCGRAVSIQGTG